MIDFFNALVILCIANMPTNPKKDRLQACVKASYQCVQGHAHGGRNCTDIINTYWDNKKLLKDLKKER